MIYLIFDRFHFLLDDMAKRTATDAVATRATGRRKTHARRQYLVKVLSEQAVWIGLFVRLFLAWCLPILLDDTAVPYTDIDYHVFSDAASYIRQGGSPYQRLTYRYTPFLAALIARLPYHGILGRYVFCVADALCGALIAWLRKRQRQSRRQGRHKKDEDTARPKLADALWWLYNPLAINICTRGSCESALVLLPVLVTVGIAESSNNNNWAAVVAGFCHGLAVHAKLYPIIYSLSFMTAFASKPSRLQANPKNAVSFVLVWIQRLLQPAPLLFLMTAAATFVGLTYLAVLYYGRMALQEGLLYHFSRVDHRHNYSMHWYWIYLARDAPDSLFLSSLRYLLLVPQLVLLLWASLGIAPHNLSLALFVQTFLFVTHNKVCTAQYFTWYLCLLPLCSHDFSISKSRHALIGLAVSVAVWLACAYCLEMQGMAVHRLVWCASVCFFGANVHLLGALLASTTKAKAA